MKRARVNIPSHEVIFFNNGTQENYTCAPQLKQFLSFLKITDIPKPYKFSFVPKNGSLIPNLTLLENILLESIHHQLIQTKEEIYLQLIQQSPNKFLKSLANKIENFHLLPNEATCEEVKIISILKALLQPHPIILLEDPELNLDQHSMAIAMKALEEENKINHRTLLISSPSFSLWQEIVTRKVHKNSNGPFIIEEHKLTSHPLLRKSA